MIARSASTGRQHAPSRVGAEAAITLKICCRRRVAASRRPAAYRCSDGNSGHERAVNQDAAPVRAGSVVTTSTPSQRTTSFARCAPRAVRSFRHASDRLGPSLSSCPDLPIGAVASGHPMRGNQDARLADRCEHPRLRRRVLARDEYRWPAACQTRCCFEARAGVYCDRRHVSPCAISGLGAVMRRAYIRVYTICV